MDIKDKIVIITGASSGLGEATARHLASLGAKLVLGARRTERLEQIVKEIQSQGGEAIAETTDVTRREDLEHLVQKTVTQFGRVDVLVNNASLMASAPMSKLKIDEWDRMIDINIKGVLYGIAAALPVMQKQKSGHIINMSSVGGLKVAYGLGTLFTVLLNLRYAH